MAEGSLDLASARILISNDDGIHAPGIKALTRIAESLSDDVWVVAPESEQSATSHSLTLRRPLRVRDVGERRFAVDGTPTDCVLVAQHHILKDRPADLVLSGINHGANLGEDVHYSGTIAAAVEGALLGLRSIALSQMRSGDRVVDFAGAEHHGPEIIRRLAAADWPADVLMNVNFPPRAPDRIEGLRVCRQGRRDAAIQLVEGRDPSGRDYLWVGDFLNDETSQPGTDLEAIVEGRIAITPLHLDLTHHAALSALAEVFA